MTVLVIAPHADDEVLGMGGTIARLADTGNQVVVAVLTGHGDEPHPLWPPATWETIRAECGRAAQVLSVSEVTFRELPAAMLDHHPGWRTNAAVESLLDEYRPVQLFLPFPFDLHLDHRVLSYSATVAARPYLERAQRLRRVAAYETLSETHLAPPYLAPGFQPNLFVDISETLERKLTAMSMYESQLQPDGLPRSLASLRALATLRGAHIGCQAAEAFVIMGEYER